MHGGEKECRTVLVGKSEGRRQLGRSDVWYIAGYLKMDFKEIGRG